MAHGQTRVNGYFVNMNAAQMFRVPLPYPGCVSSLCRAVACLLVTLIGLDPNTIAGRVDDVSTRTTSSC